MIYNILVIDDDGSLHLVDLPSKYKMEFIRNFGTENVPLLQDFESWLELTMFNNDIEKLNK